ncbi:Uncharacterised protein [Salmonella enterica subsp. enterica serovar Typhi]|nr:Uncharacterised protein [Salmonella enterica subsp. enterica serovar Typhi]CGQ29561.1 Uncharacterised protein [Salmonella enterica subsp. enterica serovar Typhi]CIM38487.1 Uncharacterised protein [Salmonella enterica subsp. enterica serovar Typhi]CIN16244.1 Uncharacterised protein [Salmonella enterica subsp. enterica serovar Typhi]
MVNTGNTLHLAFKLYTGRVGAGGSFQVFCGAQLCKHLTFDTSLLAAGCHPARLIADAVRITLQPDVLLLRPAQLLRQLPHHTVACGRLQIRQQRRQPVINLLQLIHVSPSTFLRVRPAPAPLQRLTRCRQC